MLISSMFEPSDAYKKNACKKNCVYVHHLKAEHVEDALCPDQFFLPAVEAVQARPGNNLVQLDGAGDQEYDDQDHAHVKQSVSLNDFLGIVSHSRIDNQDRLWQERENDLQELKFDII